MTDGRNEILPVAWRRRRAALTILRLLPYWPRDRYLELAPKYWKAMRAKLDPDELDAPLCSFTIPAS